MRNLIILVPHHCFCFYFDCTFNVTLAEHEVNNISMSLSLLPFPLLSLSLSLSASVCAYERACELLLFVFSRATNNLNISKSCFFVYFFHCCHIEIINPGCCAAFS